MRMSLIAGIPHHGLVLAEVEWPVARAPPQTRLRRTAGFEPPSLVTEAMEAMIQQSWDEAVDIAPALPANAPLAERWDRWHLRAEA
eukprot:10634206-Alexandrium_andersonii.AAC.1